MANYIFKCKRINGTQKTTGEFIKLRKEKNALFSGEINADLGLWNIIIDELNLEGVTVQECKEKWDNLVSTYKELKDPLTVRRQVEFGNHDVAWPFYGLMHWALDEEDDAAPPYIYDPSTSQLTPETSFHSSSQYSDSLESSLSPPGSPTLSTSSNSSSSLSPCPSKRRKMNLKEDIHKEMKTIVNCMKKITEQGERLLQLFEKLIEKLDK